MFLGHVAVALAAKKAAPKSSLGTMVAACQALDLLWPVLVLAGVESFRIDPGNTALTPLAFDVYPWSHSLVTTLLLGVMFGFFVAWWGGGLRSGIVAGCVVASHWLLDFLTHRPDLQLAPWNERRVGLGLWNSPAAAVAIEAGLFVVGVAVYLWATKARDRIGSAALWVFLLALAAIYAANLSSSPPPNAKVVAISALALWIFVVWAAWIDRHRVPSRRRSP